MSALSRPRRAPSSKPWFATFLALVIGLLAGALIPESPIERERLSPLWARLGIGLRARLRGFADRTIDEAFGRR